MTGAHDHSVVYLTLLDLAARDRILHGNLDDVANAGITTLGTTENLDALNGLGAAVVGGRQHAFLLDHESAL